MSRYTRQIALPEIGLMGHSRLQNAHIVMVGAGGLGAAALPYLAAAGIGTLTIIDHDIVDITNLHRQTIYKTSDIRQSKVQNTKNYLNDLNPDCTVIAVEEKLSTKNLDIVPPDATLLLDGSDNFKTKSLANDIAIKNKMPLISASVADFNGQIGIFKGFDDENPCYRCVFPEFPTYARNCNEAGILGTTAGILGLYQAHFALLCITNNMDKTFNFMQLDLKTMRSVTLKAEKNKTCLYCTNQAIKTKPPPQKQDKTPMNMITINNLNDTETIIIDVRQPEELIADPLVHADIKQTPLNIPLPELITRLDELPEGKRLAFICAGNIRSVQAAEYLTAKGHKNIVVLDKFSL